jgi:hypothetical protein
MSNVMKKKLKILLSVLTLLVVCTTSSLWAMDASIVRIHKSKKAKGGMFLHPPTLYVTKDTVVIWMSWVHGEEVQLVFEDGKRCMDVFYAPYKEDVFLNAQACFVTNYLTYASTTSLKFTDTGTFEYVVSTKDEKEKTTGKIIVRDP